MGDADAASASPARDLPGTRPSRRATAGACSARPAPSPLAPRLEYYPRFNHAAPAPAPARRTAGGARAARAARGSPTPRARAARGGTPSDLLCMELQAAAAAAAAGGGGSRVGPAAAAAQPARGGASPAAGPQHSAGGRPQRPRRSAQSSAEVVGRGEGGGDGPTGGRLPAGPAAVAPARCKKIRSSSSGPRPPAPPRPCLLAAGPGRPASRGAERSTTAVAAHRGGGEGGGSSCTPPPKCRRPRSTWQTGCS
jgi:hypothetical protein